MEVDEAASHIKELVDPDANIIWGSAFNNDLEGRIRVSVVATGIEAEEATMAEPARVFAFPGFKAKTEVPAAPKIVEPVVEAPVAEDPAPMVLTPPEPVMAEEPAVEAAAGIEPEIAVIDEEDVAEEPDELLLDAEIAPEPVAEVDDAPAVGSRWLAPEPVAEFAEAEPVAEAPKPAMAGGGTLFERMSNIARGAAKVEPDTEAKSDPLDIPRFLNRQNNQ
jgi:cell division protein FtsZ